MTSPSMTEIDHGTTFTASMFTSVYTPQDGWHGKSLAPIADLRMHPGTLGLHYAQTIFEGLKAFRQPSGGVAIFRPSANSARFNRSAARLCMPAVPEELFLEAVESVAAADQSELPAGEGVSMYLRPIMFGTDVDLMLRPSNSFKFLVIAFIAGGFFGNDVGSVSVAVCRDQARAMIGGTGDVKCAPNYSPSFVAQRAAAERGCQQVIWLDSAERRYAEEMGGMNLFVVRGRGAAREILTPPLSGTLLPGVTRDSILTIAQQLGYRTAETRLDVNEWEAACASGEISEIFACGTAASVTPVGTISDSERTYSVADGRIGPVTGAIRRRLLDIQTGAVPDPHGWLRRIGVHKP